MYNLEINIGLNVAHEEPLDQKLKTITELTRYFNFSIGDFKTESGIWEDSEGYIENERVLVIRLNVGRLTKDAITFILSHMALDLQQDAIAFVLNGEGSLAYEPLYEGERFEFNKDYFKTF